MISITKQTAPVAQPKALTDAEKAARDAALKAANVTVTVPPATADKPTVDAVVDTKALETKAANAMPVGAIIPALNDAQVEAAKAIKAAADTPNTSTQPDDSPAGKGRTDAPKAAGKAKPKGKRKGKATVEATNEASKSPEGYTEHYDLRQWPTAFSAIKPSRDAILLSHAIGIVGHQYRPGTKKALAMACYLMITEANVTNYYDVGECLFRCPPATGTTADHKANVALDAQRDGWGNIIKGHALSRLDTRHAGKPQMAYRFSVAGIDAEKYEKLRAFVEGSKGKMLKHQQPASVEKAA